MPENLPLSPLLLCLDLEAGSDELAAAAAQMAARCALAIRVLHVMQSPLGEADRRHREDQLRALCRKRLPPIAPEHLHLISGVPEDVIIETANRFDTGPILLGRRQRKTVERIYVGSTTSAVIALARRPVLVIPLAVDHP